MLRPCGLAVLSANTVDLRPTGRAQVRDGAHHSGALKAEKQQRKEAQRALATAGDELDKEKVTRGESRSEIHIERSARESAEARRDQVRGTLTALQRTIAHYSAL